MIAAVAANDVIGFEGGMPWRLPSDMAFFKRTTMGKPIIMGRKQYETVGKALPGRTNIVVTRQADYQRDGVIVINDFEAAIEHAKSIAEGDGVDEIVIIGGGEIYRLGLAHADRLYITHVDLRPDGDTWFPDFSEGEWRLVTRPEVPVSERDSAPFSVAIYERRAAASH